MSKTTKNKKQSKKNISFDEFKAWLSGVEDLQSEDWYPSKEQWKIIRDKIDSIKVETSSPKTNPPHPEQAHSRPVPHSSFVGGVNNNEGVSSLLPSTIPQNVMDTPQMNPPQTSRHVTRLPPVFEGKTPSMDTYTTSSFE